MLLLQSWDRPSHTMHCNHGTDPHTQCTAIMGQTLTHNALQSWDRPSHTMHCNHGTDPHTQCTAIMGQTLTHNALQSVRTPYCQTLKCCLAIMEQFAVRPSNNALLSQDSLLLDINMLYATVRVSPVYCYQTSCCCNCIVYCWTLTCFILQSGSVQFTVIKHAAVTVQFTATYIITVVTVGRRWVL